MNAKLIPHTEMRCPYCNVPRVRRNQYTQDTPLAVGEGLWADERREYTCAFCNARLICYVGHLIVSEITGAAGWLTEPSIVDAYEYCEATRHFSTVESEEG